MQRVALHAKHSHFNIFKPPQMVLSLLWMLNAIDSVSDHLDFDELALYLRINHTNIYFVF